MEKPKEKILLILVAGIGDLILGSRSIRAIKNAHPDSELHLVTSSDAFTLAVNYPYVDKVWSFPIREVKKSKKHLPKIAALIHDLRKHQFIIAANMYKVRSRGGALNMGSLLMAMKAEKRIGQDAYGMGRFLDETVPENTFDNRHVAEAIMDIAALMGCKEDHGKIELFWSPDSERKCDWIFASPEMKGREKLIGINPGGNRETHRWDIMKFSETADRLAERYNAGIAILGGPGEEAVAEKIAAGMKTSALCLAGKITLNDLAYTISRLDLLITNDSGPMHVGAAVGTNMVTIFGPGNPVFFHPYTSKDKYRVVYSDIQCRPCDKVECSREDVLCLKSVPVEDVYNASISFLK